MLAERSLRRRVSVALAAAGVLTLAAFQGPAMFERGRSLETYHAARPSVMPIAEYLLPHLAESKAPIVFANLPVHDFAKWTYLERFPERRAIPCFVRKFSNDEVRNRELLERWSRDSTEDMVVHLEVDRTSPIHFDGFDHMAVFGETLRRPDSGFVPVERKRFPELGATATIWLRPAAAFEFARRRDGVRAASANEPPRR
jgi:hypothetical protein